MAGRVFEQVGHDLIQQQSIYSHRREAVVDRHFHLAQAENRGQTLDDRRYEVGQVVQLQ